jgi:hypothetical protein
LASEHQQTGLAVCLRDAVGKRHGFGLEQKELPLAKKGDLRAKPLDRL